MNQELIDFCNYIQPIVNGSAGFIKTQGWMTHFPGTIIMMSDDEMCCSIIHIPVIFDVYITTEINRFLSLKTPEEQSNLIKEIYIVGWNIKNQHLLEYYNLFNNIDNISRCIYTEPDCYNINNFNNVSGNTKIEYVNVSNGIYNYRVPASKSITTLTKSDTASLRIYDYIRDPRLLNMKTARYTVFKKKYKLNVDIFFNLIVV